MMLSDVSRAKPQLAVRQAPFQVVGHLLFSQNNTERSSPCKRKFRRSCQCFVVIQMISHEQTTVFRRRRRDQCLDEHATCTFNGHERDQISHYESGSFALDAAFRYPENTKRASAVEALKYLLKVQNCSRRLRTTPLVAFDMDSGALGLFTLMLQCFINMHNPSGDHNPRK